MIKILVAGGAGYIGSHTVIELIKAGYEPIIVDNFSNSHESVLDKLMTITGKRVECVRADVSDRAALDRIFEKYDITAAIHFAGYKAVGESTKLPLKYYRNNLATTVALADAMLAHNVTRIVFSSSATVYKESEKMPLTEDMPLGCSNPYGWTKFMSERILTDVCAANPAFSAVLLRYFNPIGAHESGLIGEEPDGIPNNLMPYMVKVANGELPVLHVYGNDYPTVDGTGVRDYIHVVDLAKSHVLAIEYALKNTGAMPINVGRGSGYSVMQVHAAFEKATGVKVPYEIVPRRPGDIALYYAGTDRAKELLHFEAKLDIFDMCEDAWRYEHNKTRKE